MSENAPKSLIFNRTSLCVAGLLVGFGILAMVFFGPPSSQPKRQAHLLALSNLPVGTTGDVRLVSAAGKHSFKIDDSTASIIEYDENAVALPYKLYATIKFPDERYRDFEITVHADKRLSAVVDGYDPWDPITLSVNDQPVFQRIPADWSGRLRLDTNLPQIAAVRACVDINSAAGTIGLCHDTAEGRRS